MKTPVSRSAAPLRMGALALASLLAIGTAADASAGNKARNTLIGAGLGAAGGALLTHGDPWGAVGGAAAGGLIGNVLTNDHHRDRNRHDYRRYDRRHDRHDPRRHDRRHR